MLKSYKGDSENYIYILTPGGKLGDTIETWSHYIPVESNRAIFFLNKNQNFISTYDYIQSTYNRIIFRTYQKGKTHGYFHDVIYKNLNSEIYSIIAKDEYAEFKLLMDSCVDYSISNVVINEISSIAGASSFTLDFDVGIRSLNHTFELAKTAVSMTYSSNLLGHNIVSNNRLSASVSSDFSDYNIALSDVDSTKFRIEIVPQNQSSAITINENTYNIYHASININNLDLAAILSLTVDENIDLETSFFNSNGNTEELNCNTYDSNIEMPVINLLKPLIHSYNNDVYAGTRTLLTIEGTDLISDGNNTEIWFTDANNPTSGQWIKPRIGDYISPINSQKIEVYIPTEVLDAVTSTSEPTSLAGTGSFKVVNANPNTGLPVRESEINQINILYAIKNFISTTPTSPQSSGYPYLLNEQFGNRGYIVTFSDEFIALENNDGVKFTEAVERALSSWCETTNLNFTIDYDAYDTGIYDVLFDYGEPNNVSANASTKITQIENQNNCFVNVNNGSPNHPEENVKVDFIKSIKITFNDDFGLGSWDVTNFQPTTAPISVEYTALHELGHAHGLRHVNNENELMYFTPSTAVEEITIQAEAASNFIQDHSNSQNCTGNRFYEKKDECILNAVTEGSQHKSDVKVVQFNDLIEITSNSLNFNSKISIYDLNGRIIYSELSNSSLSKRINILFNTGIYIVEIRNPESRIGTKFFYNN